MSSPSGTHPAAGANDAPPVVFALTEFEMQRFFPGAQLPGMRWVDVANGRAQSWSRALAEHRPRIVVAGWSTPLLPDECVASRGGPVEYVCQVTGSVRHVVSREMLAAGLLVSNWGPLVAPLVAEHALLLLLAALRNLGAWRDFMRLPAPRQRKANLETRSLRGKRVALYGFGAIAQSLVGLLRPFQVELSAFSEGVPPELFETFGVSRAPSLAALCAGADALVCCEALTNATRHSLNTAVLATLAPGAVLVNVGRGAIVDESALIDAARSRGLRVASDVFATEPLPADSPLFTLPGAILSPHIAGPTHDYFGECGRYALANITRFLSGGNPASLIDPAIYDRST
jgi:phosphoglycerate dehydrogenase-like enzyme